MDDERRARVLAEARANIAQFRAGNLEPVEVEPRQVNLRPLVVEDRTARSLRFHAEREAERTRTRAKMKAEEQRVSNENARNSDAWNAWYDQRITAALEAHPFTKLQEEILGATIAELRKKLRDEFAEQIGELRAELNVQRSIESSKILDLPALPLRRRNDAA
jgi:hypothetical protein